MSLVSEGGRSRVTPHQTSSNRPVRRSTAAASTRRCSRSDSCWGWLGCMFSSNFELGNRVYLHKKVTRIALDSSSFFICLSSSIMNELFTL